MWLPHLLFELAARFDQAMALRFGAEFGGRRLWVPSTPQPDHAVRAAFPGEAGEQLLAWLIERYAGTEILIPLGASGSAYNRRIAEIRRLAASGASSAAIAQAAGCHERTIYRHRRALREQRESRQLDLLDDTE